MSSQNKNARPCRSPDLVRPETSRPGRRRSVAASPRERVIVRGWPSAGEKGGERRERCDAVSKAGSHQSADDDRSRANDASGAEHDSHWMGRA